MENRNCSWNMGTQTDADHFLGCHFENEETTFRVWAPGAAHVYVTGSFCGWEPFCQEATPSESGIFSCTLPAIGEYETYKFVVVTPDGQSFFKSDPFAFHTETPPGNASKACKAADFAWTDGKWYTRRGSPRPLNVYEFHAGSFRTYANGEPLNYQNLAAELVPYVKKMGYTHVSLLPILEHIDGASAGYRTTGFFAPTSRYGSPRDFFTFVNACHLADLGVILEWCPLGFPVDDFGLSSFDGSACYEPADELTHMDFRHFDFEKPEVHSFLLSSAFHLLAQCHADGLYVCQAAQIAERPGGIDFLRALNDRISADFPEALTIGDIDGARFSLVWEEAAGQALLAGSAAADFASNNWQHALWALGAPKPNDESLISRMPGGYDEKFARLRAVLACFYAYPGRKLLFMGNEFAQFTPWTPKHELDWMLLDYEMHRKFQTFVREMNDFYRKTPTLWEDNPAPDAFSVISFPEFPLLRAFSRRDKAGNEFLTLANFSEEPAQRLSLGVDRRGKYTELFTTDELKFGGEGRLNATSFAKLRPAQGKSFCVEVSVPPCGALYLYKSAGAALPKKPKA